MTACSLPYPPANSQADSANRGKSPDAQVRVAGKKGPYMLLHRLRLLLHRLDTHLGGRLRNRHFRQRHRLQPLSQSDHTRRRNQQSSSADNYYPPMLPYHRMNHYSLFL